MRRTQEKRDLDINRNENKLSKAAIIRHNEQYSVYVIKWIRAITDAMLLMIFTEVTVDKNDVNYGKESDEQSGVKILEYTFGGGVKYMEVW